MHWWLTGCSPGGAETSQSDMVQIVSISPGRDNKAAQVLISIEELHRPQEWLQPSGRYATNYKRQRLCEAVSSQQRPLCICECGWDT